MIFIIADQAGRIEVISVVYIAGSELFTGTVPEDIFDLVGLGKYTYVEGQLLAVEGWVMPNNRIEISG